MKQNVCISLSGGMDSSTLLLNCLLNYESVTAISFDYGQKHKVELERAKDLVEYIRSKGYNINYEVIQLNGLSRLLNSTLVEGGEEVPEGHYEEENMKQTVVPNRNKIFSSIAQAIALSIATSKEENCDIALGIHAGDFSVYPDCRQEFRDADFEAFKLGNWNSDRVNYYTPYLKVNKFDILKDGEECCKQLGLDFDEVYKRTNTSYKPIFIPGKGDSWVEYNSPKDNEIISERGDWYSDYKSASSVERIEAFIKLGRPDPVAYADETGPVSWEKARDFVQEILSNYA